MIGQRKLALLLSVMLSLLAVVPVQGKMGSMGYYSDEDDSVDYPVDQCYGTYTDTDTCGCGCDCECCGAYPTFIYDDDGGYGSGSSKGKGKGGSKSSKGKGGSKSGKGTGKGGSKSGKGSYDDDDYSDDDGYSYRRLMMMGSKGSKGSKSGKGKGKGKGGTKSGSHDEPAPIPPGFECKCSCYCDFPDPPAPSPSTGGGSKGKGGSKSSSSYDDVEYGGGGHGGHGTRCEEEPEYPDDDNCCAQYEYVCTESWGEGGKGGKGGLMMGGSRGLMMMGSKSSKGSSKGSYDCDYVCIKPCSRYDKPEYPETDDYKPEYDTDDYPSPEYGSTGGSKSSKGGSKGKGGSYDTDDYSPPSYHEPAYEEPYDDTDDYTEDEGSYDTDDYSEPSYHEPAYEVPYDDTDDYTEDDGSYDTDDYSEPSYTLAQELSEAELVFMAKVKEGEYKKIGTLLGSAVEKAKAGATANASSVLSALSFNNEGKVLVEVTLVSSDATYMLSSASIQGKLRYETTACVEHLCSGTVPLENLVSVAEKEEVLCIRPVIAATLTGSVNSEGDRAMFSDIAKTTFGVTGSGILVGVLSDSFDCGPGSAAADIASGDLPNNTLVLRELATCPGSDEGRAMMQLIYDVAPGTSFAFHTAFGGKADFAAGIVALADAGCKVIVDDVVTAGVAYFQDDAIAQAVNTVVARNISYFTSAGNSARQAWHTDIGFVNSGIAFANGTLHDFDSGAGVVTTQALQVPNRQPIILEFQWDEPFLSVPGSTLGCTSDIDIYVVNPLTNEIIAMGIDFNIGMDATEVLGFTPNIGEGTGLVTIGIQIVHLSGPFPQYMKWQFFEGTPSNIEFPVLSSTSYGHQNAAGAAGVGAADFIRTPAFGISPPEQEYFSSAGGTPILFSVNGTRLASPEIRQQPRFVGPDGTLTTFFGDANNRFFGTSAAAPHMAGVAALMLELNPGLTPNDIYTKLQATAIDMDDTATVGFDVGFDFGTGYGFVNASAALIPTPPCKRKCKKW